MKSDFDGKKVNWNSLIDDVVSGQWKDPQTGRAAKVPFDSIIIDETLDGAEADLIKPLNLGRRIAVVSDSNTVEAMGRRVAKSLKSIAMVDEIVISGDDLVCDESTIARLQDLTRYSDGIVAVGSGVVSDTCKHATFLDGRPFAVFGTAASMNGYAASTASVTMNNGFKTSLPSHAPRGIFLDLSVSAAAPNYLSAAGLGDSLCRPSAQIDWWASHRLLGTFYSSTPYFLQRDDEPKMIATAKGLSNGQIDSVGHLHRVLTLCGLGVCFTGVSNHGSMGEHQVSHWIDMFANKFHPGTTHGQQVGVASLAMARLQNKLINMDELPKIRSTTIDEAGMFRRYGVEIGKFCINECRKKALSPDELQVFNQRLRELWPVLREELRAMTISVSLMEDALKMAGGPIDADSLGLPRTIWRNALKYAREIRGRWSFLDLADDADLLDEFLDEEGL